MHKISILIFLLFTGVSLQAQEINWMTMDEALEAQNKEPKKIFIDAYTTWCGPCKLLDRNTFTNKDVIAYVNEHFYAVKFNAEGDEVVNYKGKKFTNPNFESGKRGRNSTHQFTAVLGIRGYPTLVFLDENANLIAPVTGYRSPQQLEIYLKLMGTNDYKKMTTKKAFAEYQESFEGTF